MTDPSSIPRMGDLQVGEDLRFQGRQWSLQRVAWVVAAAVLVAALLGLFGDGVLSGRTAEEDGLEVRFERVERHRAPSTVTIEVETRHGDGDVVELFVDRSWIEGVLVEGSTPEPEGVNGAEDRVVFSFAVEPGQEKVAVSLDVAHQGLGEQAGRIGVPGGPQVEIRQFVLP